MAWGFKRSWTRVIMAHLRGRPESAPSLDRATLEGETRTACLTLGVVWYREHGTSKYGKATLAGLRDAELLEIHTAAVAAVAAL